MEAILATIFGMLMKVPFMRLKETTQILIIMVVVYQITGDIMMRQKKV
jgi:hypothetical protein